MSVVTGIMLLIGATDWEERSIAEIQAWLEERNWPHLIDVSEATAGGKHPQFEAWGAGFNHFDEEEFIRFVLSRSWRDPNDVILIINPEEGAMQIHRPAKEQSHD